MQCFGTLSVLFLFMVLLSFKARIHLSFTVSQCGVRSRRILHASKCYEEDNAGLLVHQIELAYLALFLLSANARALIRIRPGDNNTTRTIRSLSYLGS